MSVSAKIIADTSGSAVCDYYRFQFTFFSLFCIFIQNASIVTVQQPSLISLAKLYEEESFLLLSHFGTYSSLQIEEQAFFYDLRYDQNSCRKLLGRSKNDEYYRTFTKVDCGQGIQISIDLSP